MAGGIMADSPDSDGDDDGTGDHHEKKRQPGVKRACNECRQQKVRHAPILSIDSIVSLVTLSHR